MTIISSHYRKYLERHRPEFTIVPREKPKSTGSGDNRDEDKPQEQERGPPGG